MAISLHPLTPTLGAELRGVDLAERLGDETVATIRRALLDHHVVFLREQEIDAHQQIEFCKRFGPIMPSIGKRLGDRVDGVTVLDQIRPVGQGADEWHSDHMFSPNPPLGTVLYAVQLPRIGGDTCYVDMGAAYDALSPSMQRFLDELTAINSNERTLARIDRTSLYENAQALARRGADRATHPLVRKHPDTGRKVLYASPRDTIRIHELSERESERILSLLFAHLESPELQCRFRWEPGSLAFWDNRAVQHRAIPDYRERRIMHRTMIAEPGDGDRIPTSP
ncbi:MAG: TauD/TfdA family dioxygenase [Deltaproteobacteria bacterium]|jgi:taurine dioxygenase|nr:TauD/TfdA family dioxygenase [Deltaproteobacteria bacterium]MBW2495907.1 TauD/TfdA family dioxygenase [Deltaproteobacteria bacterium]